MKHLWMLLLCGWVLQPSARAQDPIYFNLHFIGAAPPHASFLPPGGGVLNGDAFSAIVYLDLTAPESGQLLRKLGGDTFELIAPMQIIFAGYAPPIGPGTAYSVERTVLPGLDGIQALLAGDWYVEVALDHNTYLGQFVLVPEPSSLALLGGIPLMLLWRVRERLE